MATRFFNAHHAAALLEDEIDTALIAAGIEYEDWEHDAYDGSIELLRCKALTAEQQEALWGIGFARAWTHPGDTKVKADEKYYVNRAPVSARG